MQAFNKEQNADSLFQNIFLTVIFGSMICTHQI